MRSRRASSHCLFPSFSLCLWTWEWLSGFGDLQSALVSESHQVARGSWAKCQHRSCPENPLVEKLALSVARVEKTTNVRAVARAWGGSFSLHLHCIWVAIFKSFHHSIIFHQFPNLKEFKHISDSVYEVAVRYAGGPQNRSRPARADLLRTDFTKRLQHDTTNFRTAA